MSNNKNNKQPPDLIDSLRVAIGGLTMEDSVGPVNPLESQLKAIGGQDSDVLKNLKPAVRKQVEVWRSMQGNPTGGRNISFLPGGLFDDNEDDDFTDDEYDEYDDFTDDDEDDEDEEETNTKKSQLKAIGGQDSDVLENLKPAVRKRVEVLRGIQSEHDELEAKFFEEKANYQKLYAQLYSKRYDIVTGVVEVDGAKQEDAIDQTHDTEMGVPEFWLTAMKHNKITAEKITERDEEALKYLKDIKWCRMDDPKGFKLEFFFDTNPFFTNSVLTEVYHMRSSAVYHKLIFEKAIGTTIEWLPGKCLTQKVLKMMPKKGSKNGKPITKTKDCASFFNFFSPWVYGYLEFGLTIRDKIIPHAVSWFTGEANPEDFGGFDDEDDEDDEYDDEYVEDDDEDDEDDEYDDEYVEDDDEEYDDEDEEDNKIKKTQLKATGGQHSDVLENLKPAVRKRVEVLRGIQSEHDELEAKYFEEKAKYQKLIAPLYSKRYDIVTGAVEVDGAKEEDAIDQTDDTGKGVPEFWLTAMKHNEFHLLYLRYTITELDEEALRYLKDIKWCPMDDPKGFKLEFFFDTNPFFSNSVLTKVYHMSSSCYFDKLILEKAIGTTIEWLPGKCLTQKILKKKPKKGSKNAKPITKTECASFFNFFSPPGHLMREDYYIGLIIRDKIIPHAVSWFTGEANTTRGKKISVLLGGFYDEDDEVYEYRRNEPKSNYDKHPALVKILGIPDIKTQVDPRIPSQSVQASITDVKLGKKNDSLDIPASSKNDK